MCGWALMSSSPASSAARSTMRRKPDTVNGEPRIETNTNADWGFCSRCRRRKARSSPPVIGCVAGVPFLTRRRAERLD